jgi:hypothetical protein
MASVEGKPRRRRFWRPRFTVRTLGNVVTLVCMYLGMLGLTKKYGVPKLSGPFKEAPSEYDGYLAGSTGPPLNTNEPLAVVYDASSPGVFLGCLPRAESRRYSRHYGTSAILRLVVRTDNSGS